MALNSQLKEHIDSNDILSQFQSGFRNKHSCTTALVRVYEDIRLAIASNKLTILVLLDIRSAYPSVSHKLLLHELQSIGMQQSSLLWTEAFIGGKRQFVEINSKRSETTKIDCGLLQGDNLSQTFFSLVINGVTKCIECCKYHLYADDKSVYLHSDVDQLSASIKGVNSDVQIINQWMQNHGMQLNPDKTQTIIIGSRSNLGKIDMNDVPKIVVNGTHINYSSSVKYLGFTFNEIFDSSTHVAEVVKKVNFALSKVNHCKRSISPDAKSRIVNGVILPLFDYGSIIYHGYGLNGSRGDEKRVQIAHNTCIRFINKVSRFERISPILNGKGILNMFNRRQFLILCFLHNLINHGSAPYLNDIFNRNLNNTRAGMDTISLSIRAVKRTGDEFLLSNCLARLWNTLPIGIRNASSHESFRDLLFQHLLKKQREC